MANICTTCYAAIGDKDAIARLKTDLLATTDPENPENRQPWLGHYIKSIGLDPDKDLDRCGWLNLWTMQQKVDVSPDGTRLDFIIESKWGRCECLESILPSRYGVELYYMEEELGCDVFNTNDATHTVFPEYVIVDSDAYGMEYYTEDQARSAIKALLKELGDPVADLLNTKTIDEIGQYIYANYDNFWIHIARA